MRVCVPSLPSDLDDGATVECPRPFQLDCTGLRPRIERSPPASYNFL